MDKINNHLNWYGEGAELLEQHEGYSIISYNCNGSGILYDYAVFPGINLIFMDFICMDTLKEPNVLQNILEIRHYREGRIEFEFDNQKVFHLQQDEFCINAMVNMPDCYSFPFGYCNGVSLVIDQDELTQDTLHLLSVFHIDIMLLKNDLDIGRQWYICKTPSSMIHVFDELYTAKGKESIQYFCIKTLELLYYACKLRKEDCIAATYYSREYINIIKRVRKSMVDDLSNKTPLEVFLKNEPISTVTFQAVFKQVYGSSPYAYLKHYKMNCAAVQLCETEEPINQIAISLGYNNASKFSKAFQNTYGILPKDYRVQKKSI